MTPYVIDRYCSWTGYCVMKFVAQDYENCHLCNETDTEGNNSNQTSSCHINKHAHLIKKWIHELTNKCSLGLIFYVKCKKQSKGEFYLCNFIIIL